MIEFKWEGSTESDNETGFAYFQYKEASFVIQLENFALAYELHRFMNRVECESWVEAKNILVGSLQGVEK